MCKETATDGDETNGYAAEEFDACGKVRCKADRPYTGIHSDQCVYSYADSGVSKSRSFYCILPNRKKMSALSCGIL